MIRLVRWLLVLAFLVIAILTVAARTPRLRSRHHPYARVLVWFARHCKPKSVLEEQVNTKPKQIPSETPTPTSTRNIYCGRHTVSCVCMGYPCPTEITRIPTATQLPWVLTGTQEAQQTRWAEWTLTMTAYQSPTPTLTCTPTITRTPIPYISSTPRPTNTSWPTNTLPPYPPPPWATESP